MTGHSTGMTEPCWCDIPRPPGLASGCPVHGSEHGRAALAPIVTPAAPETLPDVAAALGVTDEWVIKQLRSTAQDTNEDGSSTTAALSAIQTLAKIRGMLTDRTETTHEGRVLIEIVGIPDTKRLR